MSFFDQEPYTREISDKRVLAWNKEKIHTHSDADYKQRALKGQNAAASSSIVDGRIVRAVHAKPRDTLPSNVHGFHDINKASQSSPQQPRSNGLNLQRSNTGLGNSSSNKTPAAKVNFAKVAAAGLENQRPTPAVKVEDGSAALKGQETGTPPHLRRPSAAPGDDPMASLNKLSKRGTRAPPMNSGTAEKSAKLASKFPCSYADCTLGFLKEKALKKHKEDAHDYCRFCDEDFDDFNALLFHKLETEEHICCCMCGEDFRSEAGRDRHERQAHAAAQDCACVGCGEVFDKGSGLIHHMHENLCANRNDRIPRLINEETLRKSRARAAMALDASSHLESDTGALIAAMQPKEDDESSIGGVRLESHLLDRQDPMEDDPKNLQDDVEVNEDDEEDLIEFSGGSGSVAPTKPMKSMKPPGYDFPTLGEAAAVKSKGKQKSINGNMGALTMNDSHSMGRLGDGLFPVSESPSQVGQGTGITLVDHRHAILAGPNGEQRLVPTDWDHRAFTVDEIDKRYHCPFAKCTVTSRDVNGMKMHLTSGEHQGTRNQCVRCLKTFKTPAALVAHMESNNERCKIKETDHFGQILSVVSGGFLGVKGRNADGTIKIGALNQEELDEQASEQRALLPHEDPSYNWSL